MSPSRSRRWALTLGLGLPLLLTGPRGTDPTWPRADSVEDAIPGRAAAVLPSYDPDPRPLPRGAICRIRNTAFKHPSTITSLSISADSKTAYTIAGHDTFAWDLDTGQPREVPGIIINRTSRKPSAVDDLQFHAHGNGESFSVSSVATGRTIGSYRFPHAGGRVNPITFTPDGREVVLEGGGAVLGVNVATGEWRVVSHFPGMPATGKLRLDSTGRTLAIGCQFTWELRDFTTGRVRAVLDACENSSGEFTPDGKRFVVTYDDRLVVYDVETGAALGAPIWPSQIRFTSDGRLLTQSGPTLATWDPQTGRRLGSSNLPDDFARYVDHPFGVEVAPDGDRVAYPTARNTVAVVNLKTGERSELPTIHNETPEPTLFRSDPRLVVAASDGIHFADPATGRDTLVLPQNLSRGVWGNVLGVSPDGRFLVDRAGTCWNLETKERVKLAGRSRSAGHFARFTLDGRYLIATVNLYEYEKWLREDIIPLSCSGPGPYETKLAVWEVATGRQLGLHSMSPPICYPPLLFPDGRSFAYLDYNSNVVIAELATGKLRRSFRSDAVEMRGDRRHVYGYSPSLDCSPDGRYVATHIAGSILVWDVRGMHARPDSPPELPALNRAWADLAGDDAESAFDAIRLLAAYPDRSLPFLRVKYPPSLAPDPARIAALIPALADPEYRVRERATEELVTMGRPIEPAIARAMATSESPEMTHRLGEVYKRIRRTPQEAKRTARVVEAVEWMNTPEAMRLLEAWAGGAPAARLTEEASSVLSRVKRQ